MEESKNVGKKIEDFSKNVDDNTSTPDTPEETENVKTPKTQTQKNFDPFSLEPQFNVRNDSYVTNPEVNFLDLFPLTLDRSKLQHNHVIKRDVFTGEILDVTEIHNSEQQKNSTNSLSLLRKPSAKTDSEKFVRGNSENFPFLPGGFEDDIFKSYRSGNTTMAEKQKKTFSEELDDVFALKGVKLLPDEVEKRVEKKKEERKRKLEEKEVQESVNETVNVGKNQKSIFSDDLDSIGVPESDEKSKKKNEIIRLDDIFGSSDSQTFNTIFNQMNTSDEGDTQDVHDDEKNEKDIKEPVKIKKKSSFDDLVKLQDDEKDMFLSQKQKKERNIGARGGRGSKWAIMKRMNMKYFDKLVPEMAMVWPFDLDDWQKEGVYHVENNDNVFVSAHTSSGKTVVAEYAIALSKKHLTRAIYTSPIKTLSNQKFREFKETFEDVGLITGDVQINPTASCLIMTTEILRSMLYKGADIIRDIEWVIFDEIHYINDRSRGVVWEEVLILLPKHISIVMLSATIPNTYEFADWIGRTRKKPVYVISTYKRPVPLEHFIFYSGNYFKIVDKNGDFLSGGYQNALKHQRDVMNKRNKKKKGGGRGGGYRRMNETDWGDVVDKLQKRNLLPCVVFTFSRKRCESLSLSIPERFDSLTTAHEKIKIKRFINTSIKTLSKIDRDLPQIITISSLLIRGIGVHHSGLLPLVKEVVEILFSQGLCKILFATETFAMGINMPAKTVMFNGLRKHDGVELRSLLSSEYIQMSGRAGRRGLDRVGHVMINCTQNSIPQDSLFRDLILGKSTHLESKFRLTYNMILNLLRVENFRVEDMMKRSFSESHNQKYFVDPNTIRNTKKKINEIEDSIECIYERENDIELYYNITKEVERVNNRVNVMIWECVRPLVGSSSSSFNKKKGSNYILDVGKVVVVNVKGEGVCLGVVKRSPYFATAKAMSVASICYEVIVLKMEKKQTFFFAGNSIMFPSFSYDYLHADGGGDGDPSYFVKKLNPVNLISICSQKISAIKNSKNPFISLENPNFLQVVVNELVSLWKTGKLTVFNHKKEQPVNRSLVKNFKFVADLNNKKKLISKIANSLKCSKCNKLQIHFNLYKRRFVLENRLSKISKALSDDNLSLLPEFKTRMIVLKELGYISKKNNVIQLKGRVATEVNACESLIITEILFENMISDMTEEEIISLFSCLVCKDKTNEEEELNELSDRLKFIRNKLIKLTKKLANIQLKCGLKIDPFEYVKRKIRIGLMNVSYQWAKGVPFSEISKITEIQAGQIVRAIIQIGQILREVKNCARVVGDRNLMKKMDKANNMIKRDIVFAASLYLN